MSASQFHIKSDRIRPDLLPNSPFIDLEYMVGTDALLNPHDNIEFDLQGLHV